MQSGLYVGLAAQMVLLRKLETLSNNVANASTAGFRGEEIRFDSVSLSQGGDRVAFPSAGRTTLSQTSGTMEKTGNSLDVAVAGSGYMAVSGPGGEIYTRDGRMTMSPDGALISVSGHAFLDVGGAPILLNPDGGPPTIAKDGMITQAGQQVGAIGLFELDPSATLTRGDGAGLVSDRPATPILDFSLNGVVQGYVEKSNVNAIDAVSRLISVQRMFDGVSATIAAGEASLTEAIKTLGGSQ